MAARDILGNLGRWGDRNISNIFNRDITAPVSGIVLYIDRGAGVQDKDIAGKYNEDKRLILGL